MRQVAIEGVCKMMFVPKLCDQNDQNKVETIIAQLLFQLFDKKYNWQNSLVRSILTLFLKEFVLFSEKRCQILLNALTKVVYSIFRAKFGVNLKKKAEAKAQKAVAVNRKKKKKESHSSEEDSEESVFSVNENMYLTDDSEFAKKTAKMTQICESMDSL